MKKDNERYTYFIEYFIIRTLNTNDEPSFVTKKMGTIKAYDFERDDSDNEIHVGSVTIKNFHIGAMKNKNIDPIDVFDLESQDYEIYNNLFDSYGELKTNIDMSFDNFGLDICVIDNIFINPEWRGNDITRMVVDDISIQNVESCKFIVLKSFPLQHEGGQVEKNLKLEEFKDLESDAKKASKKLNKYYKDLGFVNIAKIPKDILFKSF